MHSTKDRAPACTKHTKDADLEIPSPTVALEHQFKRLIISDLPDPSTDLFWQVAPQTEIHLFNKLPLELRLKI
jgi:hypothetical protein